MCRSPDNLIMRKAVSASMTCTKEVGFLSEPIAADLPEPARTTV